MKRAKGFKITSPEPADESPRGNTQKHARISDLNKSKYLSPCRSVGLTRKRKIFSNGNVIKNETKKIDEKEHKQNKENVTGVINVVPKEDTVQSSGEVLSKAFDVVTVQNDPIVKLTDVSSVTCIENSLKKTKSVARIKRTDSDDPDFEDVPLSKVAKIERSKTRVSIKSKSVKNASKRTRSLVVLPVQAVPANGDDDDDDFIDTKTIIEKFKPREEELETLIKKWRKGCQAALEELLNITKETIAGNENVEMEALLLKLNIPVELVKYNLETSSFD